jgi:hypothetical protein
LTDPSGLWADLAIEVVSIGTGVWSFCTNVGAGDWGAAAVDAGGIVLDVGLAVVPGAPGGTGLVVKAGREAAERAAREAAEQAARAAREAAEKAAKGGGKCAAPKATVTPKIQRQMGPRGWTQSQIDEAIRGGRQVPAINKATGNPATRYVHPTTGQSVVVDRVTGEVIHVGGPGFNHGIDSGDLPLLPPPK